jgi:hypothetical protein
MFPFQDLYFNNFYDALSRFLEMENENFLAGFVREFCKCARTAIMSISWFLKLPLFKSPNNAFLRLHIKSKMK